MSNVECRDQIRWAKAWLAVLLGLLVIVLAAL
jgi:hypothetical protein